MKRFRALILLVACALMTAWAGTSAAETPDQILDNLRDKATKANNVLSMADLEFLPKAAQIPGININRVAFPAGGGAMTGTLGDNGAAIVLFHANDKVGWVLAARPAGDTLGDVVPRLSSDSIVGKLKLPGVLTTFTSGDKGAEPIDHSALPVGARAALSDALGGGTDFALPVSGESNMLLPFELGALDKLLGTKKTFYLAGDLGVALAAFREDPGRAAPVLRDTIPASLISSVFPDWLLERIGESGIGIELSANEGLKLTKPVTLGSVHADVTVTFTKDGPTKTVEVKNDMGAQQFVSMANAIVSPNRPEPHLPATPGWLPVNKMQLQAFKLALPTGQDGDVDIQGGLRGLSGRPLSGSIQMPSGGNVTAPRITLAVPISENTSMMGVSLKGLDPSMSLTLGGGDGVVVDFDLTKKGWVLNKDLAPVIANLDVSVGHNNTSLNKIKMTVTIGGGTFGGKKVPSHDLEADLPLNGNTPMLSLALADKGQSLESVLNWMVSVMAVDVRERLRLQDGLPWPDAAPFTMADVPIPSLQLDHPIPGFTKPTKDQANGLRLGLKNVTLPLPNMAAQNFVGDLVDGAFALDLPLGKTWKVKGVNWLELNGASMTLLLGGKTETCKAPARLKIAGDYPLTASKKLDIAMTTPLSGGGGEGCSSYMVAFDGAKPQDRILAFSDLVIVAINAVQALGDRSVKLDPNAIGKMMKDFDISLRSPSLTMRSDGFSLDGQMYVANEKLANIRGDADENGFEIGKVDLSRIDLKIPGVNPWDAKSLGVALGLEFFIATPKAPFMVAFTASPRDGKPTTNALGIKGLTLNDFKQSLEFGGNGSLALDVSGKLPVASKRYVEIDTRIGVAPDTGPSANVTGTIDRLTHKDFVVLLGKGANLRGFENIEIQPVGGGNNVSMTIGTSSFGFSGKLLNDGKTWGEADVTIGLPVMEVKGTAGASPKIGNVQFRDLAIDGKAGVRLPYLRFCATAEIDDPVSTNKKLTEKVKFFSGPPQGFIFDGEIEELEASFQYSLGGSDLFDVGASMSGPRADAFKDKLVDEIIKTGKPIKDSYKAYHSAVDAFNKAANAVTDWVNANFKPYMQRYNDYGMPTYDDAKDQCSKLLGIGGMAVCVAEHGKDYCNDAKAQCGRFNDALDRYGASKVKKWFKAHSQSEWNAAGTGTDSYKKSDTKKNYDSAKASKDDKKDDMEKHGSEDKVKQIVDALDQLEANKDTFHLGTVGFDLNPKSPMLHVYAGMPGASAKDYYVSFKDMASTISQLASHVINGEHTSPGTFKLPPMPDVGGHVLALACPKFGG